MSAAADMCANIEGRFSTHIVRRPPRRNVCGTHVDYGFGRIDTDSDPDPDKPWIKRERRASSLCRDLLNLDSEVGFAVELEFRSMFRTAVWWPSAAERSASLLADSRPRGINGSDETIQRPEGQAQF
jgi:hypothetical protein